MKREKRKMDWREDWEHIFLSPGEEQISIYLPSVPASFLPVWQNTSIINLKGGKIYFGLPYASWEMKRQGKGLGSSITLKGMPSMTQLPSPGSHLLKVSLPLNSTMAFNAWAFDPNCGTWCTQSSWHVIPSCRLENPGGQWDWWSPCV
jgi:hypothetical protein